ncbi:tyrosine-type recombinase/integrase [Streptomyces sp. NPDC057623]|uniref:tyrosine-type recombinase/integrase n=1 Tax=Streptomyces sp. NPDC057623 TaxID=3346187 RepID=UPI003684988B
MAEIKRIVLGSGKVRYRTVVDVGASPKTDPVSGEVIIDEATGKPVMKRNQLTITMDKKTEVQAEVDRIRGQKANGTLILPNEITVGEWLDRWLVKMAEDLEVTTIAAYETTLKPVRKKLGYIRLQELTEEQVEEFRDWMLTEGRVRPRNGQRGLSTTTVEMALGRLKEALNRAVTKRLVAINAAENVTIPRKARKAERRAKVEVPPWTPEEVRLFVAGILDERLYAPLLLGIMGLRPAEVCGIRWEDVDLELRTLEIANTRTMIDNNEVVEKDTKSEAGERVLPIPGPLLEALKKFRARQAAEKLALGADYLDQGYVTVDAVGEVLKVRHLRVEAYRLMEKLGLRRVRLYDARASCLTYLANNGVPDHILARWAGHANVKTTKKWYIKPSVEDLRGAAATWEGLHGPSVREREM